MRSADDPRARWKGTEMTTTTPAGTGSGRKPPMSTPMSTEHTSRPTARPATSPARFVRHYLLMVVAMYAGMLVLDPVYAAVASRAGYADPWTELSVVSALVMALNMTVPMVLLMLRHHHSHRAICEMAAAMIAPTVAAAAVHVVGVIGADQVMSVAHLGMFPAMFLVMLAPLLRLRRGTPRPLHQPHNTRPQALLEEPVMTTVRHHTEPSAHPRGSQPGAPYDTARHQDLSRLRAGTVAMLVGLLSQVPLESAHPHQEYANDSAAAFHEYAHSHDWVLVHLGQFVGVLVLTVGLVAVATSLARQRGAAGFLGMAAAATAVTSGAVFAVQMAVDGVALKAAVDAWVPATGVADRDIAYQVAESIRSVENGLSALFNTINGITMMSLGAGLALTRGPGPPAGVDRRRRGRRPGRGGRAHGTDRLLPRGDLGDEADNGGAGRLHRRDVVHRLAPKGRLTN